MKVQYSKPALYQYYVVRCCHLTYGHNTFHILSNSLCTTHINIQSLVLRTNSACKQTNKQTNNEVADGVHGDTVHRLHEGAPYFRSVIQFYVTRVYSWSLNFEHA